jgi:hypothetical protein
MSMVEAFTLLNLAVVLAASIYRGCGLAGLYPVPDGTVYLPPQVLLDSVGTQALIYHSHLELAVSPNRAAG